MPQDIPRILLATEGYLELGMLDHAALELEHVEPEARMREDVLYIRCRIYMAAQKWEAMRDVARHLVLINAQNVQHWIWAAWATRRSENISAAKVILQRAKSAHPADPMIDYNLACYSCQMGEIEEARMLLKNAIIANETFKMMALQDPDLEPLW